MRANPDNSHHLIDKVLSRCLQMGATSAEASISTGNGLSVTVRMGQVETIEHERDTGLTVTVYRDGRKGSASSTDFSNKAIDTIVDAACTIAKHASEDECAGLLEAQYLARAFPDLDLHHAWEIHPQAAMDMALACEDSARNADKRLTNSDGTSVSTYVGSHVYGNTHDFIHGWDWSSHHVDCTVIAEKNGHMQRDGWYTRARDHRDLDDIKAVAKEAAHRTLSRLGAQKLSTRSAPVIFEAPVAKGLFTALITAISGNALYRKATFLLDKLGEEIFAPHIHIEEQPHLRKALGSAPFDNDGMGTQQKHVIKNGVLETYLLSAYSARKLGMAPTGNAGGVHNLVVHPGDQDLPSLLRQMDTGLLVTDMIGFGINPITGDYSRGASGFWVQGGERQYPVEEITIAGNLADMFRQIISVGNDVDKRGNIMTGSVLMENMIIAGE